MRELAIILLAFCSACATATPPREPPIRGDSGHRCRDGQADRFVGQQASAALGAQMLAASGAGRLRWVAHDAMITMEFNPSRLTVRLDDQNRILSATCG